MISREGKSRLRKALSLTETESEANQSRSSLQLGTAGRPRSLWTILWSSFQSNPRAFPRRGELWFLPRHSHPLVMLGTCFSDSVCVYVCVLFAQSCPTLCDPVDCNPPGFSVPGTLQNTGMGCYALLQGIFRTQVSNPGLLHCRQIVYRLSQS